MEDKRVMEVSNSFLYRGKFTDYENTFETIQEPDYLVELANDADVGVLQSKEWFEWDDDSKPLQAGTGLVFRLKSEVAYKDKVNYKSVSVSGDVFVRDQLKRLVKAGSVDFERDDCQGNPVVAYVQRNVRLKVSLRRSPMGIRSPPLVRRRSLLRRRTSCIRRSRAISTRFTLTRIRTMRTCLERSRMGCDRVPRRGDMSRVWLRVGHLRGLFREFIFPFLFCIQF